MKKFCVDRGAIKFVLAGANVMCPGLTSAGGALDEEVPSDAPVVSSPSLSLLAITHRLLIFSWEEGIAQFILVWCLVHNCCGFYIKL